MWQKVFVGWIGLFPFIVLHSAYEGPKVLWLWTGSIVLFLFWIFRLSFDLTKIITRSDYFYFLWLAVLTLSSMIGVHPLDSLVGGSYRHQGVIFFLSLWVIGKTVGILEKRQILIYKMFLVGACLESIMLILERLLSSNEPLGTFGNANAAAGFVALSLLFPKDYLSKVQKKLFYLINCLGVVFSCSLSALIVFVYSVLKRKYFFPILAVIAGGIILSGSKDFNNPHEGRKIIWELAITSIAQRPILGYGAESGEMVFDKAYKTYGTPLVGLMVDRAHNIFLDIAMWSGILGLILFICWILMKIKEMNDEWRKIALIGWLVFACLQPLGVVHWIILAVFLF